MFIADLFHMPQQACGVWPALYVYHRSSSSAVLIQYSWTVSHTSYPLWGEIDILENINEQTSSKYLQGEIASSYSDLVHEMFLLE